MIRISFIAAALIALNTSVAYCTPSGSLDTTDFYTRLVADFQQNKPLVATVFVALCDNDSQGIVPVKNRSICNGDTPKQNMYWKGNGISGYLRQHGWKKVSSQKDMEGTILIQQIWKKEIFASKLLRSKGSPKIFTAYIVTKAYRGSNIHNAIKDYLTAVNFDTKEAIETNDGTSVLAGGKSHIVGYIGHDYFMDVHQGQPEHNDLMTQHQSGSSQLAKGTFALACVSNEFVRPAVTRANVYIFAMNNFLTYPSAWTVGGIINGISRGGNGKVIHKQAARYFAKGQKCGLKWATKAFSYGP